jgi:hypothetical protein
MAYLNVRERRVETTIAYLGPLGAGKATNLAQLGRRSHTSATEPIRRGDERGEALVLDWTATAQAFRDCSVSVKLLSPIGPSPERLRRIVEESDGIVLVLGAEPAAAVENERFAELVREAVAASAKPKVPVVVQVNKSDLPDAMSAEDVVRRLDAAWPHLTATALSGEGVVATLERAVEQVLNALQGSTETATEPLDSLRGAVDANPLLTALKQVLKETVRDHVAELGRDFAERLARDSVAAMGLQEKATAELAALRLALVDESARTRASLTVLQEEIGLLRQSTNELRLRVTTGADETVRALVATSASLATQSERLAEVESSRPTREDVTQLSNRVAEVAHDVSAHGSKIDRLSAEREDERTLEAITELSSRVDTMVSTLTAHGVALAKLEAHTGDTTRWDRFGARVDALATNLSSLDKKTIAPLAGELTKMRAEARKAMEDLAADLPRSNDEVRTDLLRALEAHAASDRQHVTSTMGVVQATLASLSDAVDRADGTRRLASIATTLDELRTELIALKSLDDALKVSSRKADEFAALATSADARTEMSLEELRGRLADLQSELKKKKSWFT